MKIITHENKICIFILVVIMIDIVIGSLLFINRSFPRLAMWRIKEFKKWDDFYWEPQNKPDYFYFEPDSKRPSIFREEILPTVKNKTDELEKAIEIARFVGTVITPQGSYKGGVRWDSPEGMLRQARAGRGANCFYQSILYSTYLSSIGMHSRLWTLEGDDELEKLSHTVTEAYIASLKRWVLIDVTLGVYFTKDNYPLSVLGLRNELLAEESDKILVRSTSEQIYGHRKFLEGYARLLKCVFLRSGNDFVNKYDTKIRYGILSRFQKYLDKPPSTLRRGLSYLFGRQDFLIHYVDSFSKSLRPKIVIARLIFYFFVISSALICVHFLVTLVVKILRKSPLAINLSRNETRHR